MLDQEKKIFVIGTGTLGKRYIDAVSKIRSNYRLILHDHCASALRTAEEFIIQNNLRLPHRESLESLSQTLDAIDQDSVVVIATTAKDRHRLLRLAMNRLPRAIICEKLVTQSLVEYQDVMDAASASSVPVFVNFTLRWQPFIQKIKSEIPVDTGYLFFGNMPRTGLACASIHHIDLACWLFGVEEYEFISSHFVETYEQKRKGFVDIAGSMHLKTRNGVAHVCNSNLDNLCTVQIILPDVVYDIYEDQRVVTRLRKQEAEKIEAESVEYVYLSSFMPQVIESCMNGTFVEARSLPGLNESFLAHKILFDYMDRHSLSGLNIT